MDEDMYPAITMIEHLTNQSLSQPIREALDSALAYWYAAEETFVSDDAEYYRDAFIRTMHAAVSDRVVE